MYLTKEMTIEALKNMSEFHQGICTQFDRWGMDFKSNLGRRNIVMSQTQEHFFAKELGLVYKGVDADGRTGKADIVIGEINKELECKLTSGNRGKSVTYSFQTDWATLENKGKLDYLYVLCDENFEKFCVLYFEDLTADDFFPPANGSRGKSRMRKASAMKKVTCLHGNYKIQNEKFIESYKNKVGMLVKENTKKAMDLQRKYFSEEGASPFTVRNKIIKMREDLDTTFSKKINLLKEKITFWEDSDPRFTFILESLP